MSAKAAKTQLSSLAFYKEPDTQAQQELKAQQQRLKAKKLAKKKVPACLLARLLAPRLQSSDTQCMCLSTLGATDRTSHTRVDVLAEREQPDSHMMLVHEMPLQAKADSAAARKEQNLAYYKASEAADAELRGIMRTMLPKQSSAAASTR